MRQSRPPFLRARPCLNLLTDRMSSDGISHRQAALGQGGLHLRKAPLFTTKITQKQGRPPYYTCVIVTLEG